ncbi:MAG: hypothetical protein AB7F79_06460 [Steroidobacteraceae bacterium]
MAPQKVTGPGDQLEVAEASSSDIEASAVSTASTGREKDHSQASRLVTFVEAHAELFHDANKDVYAQDRESHETRRIDGRQFRDWLAASFYRRTGKSARDQSVREALATLGGLGRLKGEQHEVFIRVAQHRGAYFLDLAESGQSRAVKIEPGSWQIVSNPPVRFIRSESMRTLPEPAFVGDLAALWEIANIPEDSRLLVLTWLIDCLRPDTPFPVLELIGEQGSAKSTTQDALRRLIDPNACNLRAAPKTPEDVFVAAGASWITSYENISHLSAPMQDAFCVLATGGGYAKRKLYTDSDESIINVKRPVVLNGISVAVTAQDLVDRTLSIETPVITARQETTDLWGLFEANHGLLLGGLLEVMAEALAKLPAMKLPANDRPRLVEFAHLGMAVAEAFGSSALVFMAQFNACRQESIARTIDASPVAGALIEWFDARGRMPMRMSIKAIMQAIELNHRPAGTDAWPRSPKGFADALRRAAPALRQLGIECKSLGKQGSHVLWEIKPLGVWPEPCRASRDVVGVDAPEHDMTTFTTSRPELSTTEIVELEL